MKQATADKTASSTKNGLSSFVTVYVEPSDLVRALGIETYVVSFDVISEPRCSEEMLDDVTREREVDTVRTEILLMRDVFARQSGLRDRDSSVSWSNQSA